MKKPKIEDLEQAFRNTAFEACIDERDYSIKIDETSAEFAVYLDGIGVKAWAFFKAPCPYSKISGLLENCKQNVVFEVAIMKLGLGFCEGLARPLQGTCVPEEGYFVFGIRQEQALKLVRQFEQYAFVCGEAGGKARLVLCLQGAE